MTSSVLRAAATAVATLAWLTAVGGLAVGCSSDSTSGGAASSSPTVGDPATATAAGSATPDSAPSVDPGSPTATGSPSPLPHVDSPTDAVVADFCAANTEANAPGTDDTVAAAKQAIEQLRRTGTPPGIPADARAGFLILIGIVVAIPDDATHDQAQQAGSDLGPADQAEVVAYFTYATKTCTAE